MSIVVTGATGHLGHLVVEKLLERGIAPDEVVATGRALDRIADLADRGVRTAALDYAEPHLDGILEAGDTLLLVSGSEPGGRVALHRGVIEAAVKGGARRIVYTSAPKADDTTLVLAPDHAGTEQVLRTAGVPFTILRNNWYIENYAASLPRILAAGEVLGSAGDGRVASATRADYAEATAVVLTTDGHDDAVYELSGDSAWTFGEFAAALSSLVGREIAYRPVGSQEHLEALRAAGLDEGTAGFVVALDGNIRDGELDLVRPDLSRLVGHPVPALADQLRTLL
jgi:NAD(P)H dehydrogenase (quinone)